MGNNFGKERRKRRVHAFGENILRTNVVQESFSTSWDIVPYSDITEYTDQLESLIFMPKPLPSVRDRSKKLWNWLQRKTGRSNDRGDDVSSVVSRSQWQLKVYPRYPSSGFNGTSNTLTYFGIELHRKVDAHNWPWSNWDRYSHMLNVRCKFSLVDSENRPFVQHEGNYQFRPGDTFGPLNLITTSALVSTPDLIESDTLRIQCDLSVGLLHSRKRTQCSQVNEGVRLTRKKLPHAIESQQIIQNLKDLLINPEFSDLTLTTRTKMFRVHKVILSARSPVFKAMLMAPMLESSENNIHIVDFEEKVVEGMLQFIYTGYVNDLKKIAFDLLPIAEKYDLQGLKQHCELEISNTLTVKNAGKLLMLSNLYNAMALKADVVDFINLNKEAVMKTSSFQEISKKNKEIIVEIYLSQQL